MQQFQTPRNFRWRFRARPHTWMKARLNLAQIPKSLCKGSRPDIRVPMREISRSDTPASMGAELNPPIYVYDTSGPYTDPEIKIDIRAGSPRYAKNGSTSAGTLKFSPGRLRPMVDSAWQTPSLPKCVLI